MSLSNSVTLLRGPSPRWAVRRRKVIHATSRSWRRSWRRGTTGLVSCRPATQKVLVTWKEIRRNDAVLNIACVPSFVG
eukprot:1716074-Pyramimonas_sp.AAC.1